MFDGHILRDAIAGLAKRLIGFLHGSTSYRLGRALYKQARGDIPNDMKSNGETLVQACVVNAWRQGEVGSEALVVFDVGANVGDWTTALLGLLRAEEAELTVVHAFEPVPSTFGELQRRLGTNPAVNLVQAALSSASGKVPIFVSGLNAGSNSLHSISGDAGHDCQWVSTLRADEFSKQHGLRHIHLLKCDTEGHDLEVIRGAMSMLDAGAVSVLQFEYNHRWVYSRSFLRDVFVAVQGTPYRVAKLQADGLLMLEDWHPELEKFFEGNYLLVHAEVMDWFPSQQVSWDRFNAMQVDRA